MGAWNSPRRNETEDELKINGKNIIAEISKKWSSIISIKKKKKREKNETLEIFIEKNYFLSFLFFSEYKIFFHLIYNSFYVGFLFSGIFPSLFVRSFFSSRYH